MKNHLSQCEFDEMMDCLNIGMYHILDSHESNGYEINIFNDDYIIITISDYDNNQSADYRMDTVEFALIDNELLTKRINAIAYYNMNDMGDN